MNISLEKKFGFDPLTVREKETLARQGIIRKGLMKVLTLQDHPDLKEVFFDLEKTFDRDHYIKGKGVYENYFFNGQNPHLQDYFTTKPQGGDFSMFENIELQKALFERPNKLNFDAHPQAKSMMNTFMHALIGKNIHFNGYSKEFLQEAIDLQKKTGKKIIILGTHSSNFDAPAYQYVLSKHCDISGYDLRFLCGTYMHYSNSVNKFNTAFNTTLVVGEGDFDRFKNFLLHQRNIELLRQRKEQPLNHLLKNPEKEISIAYAYAGRSYDTDNGCKKNWNSFMDKYVTHPDFIYLPMGLIGTKNIEHYYNLPPIIGGPLVKLQKTTLGIDIGKPFLGGQMTPAQIHDKMNAVGMNALFHSKSKRD